MDDVNTTLLLDATSDVEVYHLLIEASFVGVNFERGTALRISTCSLTVECLNIFALKKSLDKKRYFVLVTRCLIPLESLQLILKSF